ncbi:MAG: DNA-protecting protein DprA [SAR86 cluster bacterium]|uniref:DNA-protecting protein DprA n=1 Tax=SAR86 cluster bacterium TaxID=2030880 RepID=A0A2A5B9N7_9GAMM|nr:MAG: DNA-protecting protein DprA [SAR86 cluster bacterium]
MDAEKLSLYLCLYHSRSISVLVFSRLLKEFGTLERIQSLPAEQLQDLGFDEGKIAQLKMPQKNARVAQLLEKDMNWAENSQHSIICYESSHYPTLLKEVSCAPPVLYVVGDKTHLRTPQFAIVGSRKASIDGRRNAYWMANELSQAGLTISSGMAKGIDSYAHQGALDAQCPTIAVMGTGADRVYPACNDSLAQQIKLNGALVSEFPLGTPPHAYNFPRRNRIISGMSLGTLVVEATHKSGSLITSRYALEQNRDVFAFPGPISKQSSHGCHRLIKEGAKLVESPDDILEELGVSLQQTPDSFKPDSKNPASDDALSAPQIQAILDAIGYQGCVIQVISNETGLEYQQLSTCLLELEMQGKVLVEGGRYFRVT